YVTSSLTEVGEIGFVKDDQQQTTLLELRARQQRRDVGFQPLIGCREHGVVVTRSAGRTGVRVIGKVGHNHAERRKRSFLQVSGELSKRHNIRGLSRIAYDVAEVSKGIVMFNVVSH